MIAPDAQDRSLSRVLSSLRQRLIAAEERFLSLTRLDRLTVQERWLLIGVLAAILWGLIGVGWEKVRYEKYPSGDPSRLYDELRAALPEGEVVPGINQ
jgi:hypothetical protein